MFLNYGFVEELKGQHGRVLLLVHVDRLTLAHFQLARIQLLDVVALLLLGVLLLLLLEFLLALFEALFLEHPLLFLLHLAQQLLELALLLGHLALSWPGGRLRRGYIALVGRRR